jgi:ketosteroid isomerase-like protein
MSLRFSVAIATAALTLGAGWAANGSRAAPAAESCDARPVVEQFFAALKAGDLARLDELFGREDEGWRWYSIADRAGQRLGYADSMNRSSLRAYFTSRIARHEQFRLLRIDENGSGNFGIVVERRADDLREGRWVERHGKGWVSCTTRKINVWTLGGAPPPSTFGPCPQGVLPLARTDLLRASETVLRFVRDVYSEMSPALDITGARVTRAALAPGNVLGYAARVKCGRAIQSRTAVVEVKLPRVTRASRSVLAFYASRTRAGWLVWRLVP